jgi:hypothetical protein
MGIIDDSGAVTYRVSCAKSLSGVVPQEQEYYGLIVSRQLLQHVIQHRLPKTPVCSEFFISSACPRGVYEKNPLPHQSVEVPSNDREWYCLIADKFGPLASPELVGIIFLCRESSQHQGFEASGKFLWSPTLPSTILEGSSRGLSDLWIRILAEDYNADISWFKAVECAANVGSFRCVWKRMISAPGPDLPIVWDLKGFWDRLEIWSRTFGKKYGPARLLG